jgi:phosphorylase kinase alpha/beta subunit
MYFITFLQGVDASLIPTVSFPAFATHEDVLCVETKANVIHRLKGRYGFKRFVRDGYKCVLEDSSRRYYRNGETKVTGMNFLCISERQKKQKK